MGEINYSINHINVDAMGLPLEKMNTISFGNGPKRIIAFVDPLCGHCNSFIKKALKRKDEFTFKIIVVPALGDKSNVLAKSLFCASDKSQALELFLENKLHTLPQTGSCDTKFYDLTLFTAQSFGIKAVPFFIAPDGRFKAGVGDIWNWAKK